MPEELISQKIKAAGRCALIAHVAPDGDTLGSALALSLALDGLGVENAVYCQDAVPSVYYLLPGWRGIREPDEDAPAYPLAVSVDVSDHARLGTCACIFDAAAETIVLDHHITNDGFGDYNLVLSRSATAQIVLELIDLMGAAITDEIAVNLYVALSTDTGNFNYLNTTGDALRAAARLADVGIDISSITRNVFRTRSPAKTKLLGRALDLMRFEAGGKVAVICLTNADMKECGAEDSDSEGIINYAIDCTGVEVAVMARETRGGTKLSMRSTGRVNVGTLAGSLGGGGHDVASGVTRPEPMPKALDVVLAAVLKELSA